MKNLVGNKILNKRRLVIKQFFIISVLLLFLLSTATLSARIEVENSGFNLLENHINGDDSQLQQTGQTNINLTVPILGDSVLLDQAGLGAPGLGAIGPLSLIYNTLVSFNFETKCYEPELAYDWFVTEDNTEWIFILREDILFHNGEKLTSNAVELLLERLLNPNHPTFVPDNYLVMDFNAFSNAYDHIEVYTDNLFTIYLTNLLMSHLEFYQQFILFPRIVNFLLLFNS